VWGDRKYLRQAIWNLLSNAIKFTQNDGQIIVRLVQVAQTIELQVIDTGQGITPDLLPHIFEQFRQVDGTTTRAQGGLGLGLSLVYYIVELHGGTIEVASEGVGRGATFTMKLPTSARGLTQTIRSLSWQSSNAATLSLSGLKILIVEDKQDSRELLEAILEQYGAASVAVPSSGEGLEVLRRQSFDLLISDIGMPDEDGYSFIASVRRLASKRQRQTPAIALSAYSSDEECRRALAAGFQVYLTKPVDPEELVEIVAMVVGVAE
jgi:CheY-like chemotaxis protein/anti-sigma regulatory factor (Ser/Thr protein kinase)